MPDVQLGIIAVMCRFKAMVFVLCFLETGEISFKLQGAQDFFAAVLHRDIRPFFLGYDLSRCL